MNSTILSRKGARKIEDIPQEVLRLLNDGKIETVNLTEWLAVNHQQLITQNFNQIGVPEKITDAIVLKMHEMQKPTAMNTIKLVGATLFEHIKDNDNFPVIFGNISTHLSDSIRCYAPYFIALDSQLSIEEKLNNALPLIADKHFGVREVVWMALRPEIDVHLETAIDVLSRWTSNSDENIRRFTTEATRPRGVWCKHIEALKEHPEKALPILTPLKTDSSKYVQDSVGNWLNDASKSQPEFVVNLCQEWLNASPTKATEKIVKRARRSIDKK